MPCPSVGADLVSARNGKLAGQTQGPARNGKLAGQTQGLPLQLEDSMNFIFDIGNVLVDFKPRLLLENLFDDPSMVEAMHQTIFQSPEWEQMDQGLLTHQEATAIYCGREPGFRSAIRHTMQHLNDMFTPLADTVALLPQIKDAGHKLYYLSNIHTEIRDHLLSAHSFFDLFDGGVFSCDVRMMKPSADIYRHLLEVYQLSPENCVFFDDMEKNITAAQNEGLQGVLFTDAACVKAFLDSTL